MFSQSFFEQNVFVQLTIIVIFNYFCYFEIKPEMRDVLEKMRELSQMRDFPHDCGTVGTYVRVNITQNLNRSPWHKIT